RLEALHNYNILDTLPEQCFDDITLLASTICATPVSLISFIDKDRQWFKSETGLGMDATSRDSAFCAYALHQPNELLNVPDASCDERFADNPLVTGAPHIRFYAGAPLVTPSGEVLGTLCVIDQRTRELTETQQQALRALARQTMAQLDMRRKTVEMADHMALHVQTQAALRDSERRFQAFMDRSPLTAFLKDEHGRYIYVNEPFLKRVRHERDLVIGHDDFELWPDIAPLLHERDLQVLAGNEVIGMVERALDSNGNTSYFQIYKFPLPLGGGGRVMVAGIGLDVTQNKLYEQQLEETQHQLEAALEYVRAQSLRDGLTELHNRRAFDLKMTEEYQRAQRYHLPLSVIMLDVDHFKSFNDEFGHPEGDELLQNIARQLQDSARTHDFVARYGGEEFVVILPNTAEDGACVLAERFRQAVSSMYCQQRTVTISLGVAVLTPKLDNEQAFIAAADKALYEAKRSGRNTVKVAPQE
ncbi:MAG: diguanylate cyclase, partial [Cytophagaceae bacterium]